MECHDSRPQLSHGVPWLATPVTKFVEVLNEQIPDTPTRVHVNNHDFDADPVTKETCSGTRTNRLVCTLDVNPLGVHVDKGDFDISAQKTQVRQVLSMRTPCHSCLRMRVTDVLSRVESLMVATRRRDSGDDRLHTALATLFGVSETHLTISLGSCRFTSFQVARACAGKPIKQFVA